MTRANLTGMEQAVLAKQRAEKMIGAAMDSCSALTFAMLVATSPLKNAESYRESARIALEATPYLFEAMGKISIKEVPKEKQQVEQN